jgi:hypothetical protein
MAGTGPAYDTGFWAEFTDFELGQIREAARLSRERLIEEGAGGDPRLSHMLDHLAAQEQARRKEAAEGRGRPRPSCRQIKAMIAHLESGAELFEKFGKPKQVARCRKRIAECQRELEERRAPGRG